jgi:hypothetical protein
MSAGHPRANVTHSPVQQGPWLTRRLGGVLEKGEGLEQVMCGVEVMVTVGEETSRPVFVWSWSLSFSQPTGSGPAVHLLFLLPCG